MKSKLPKRLPGVAVNPYSEFHGKTLFDSTFKDRCSFRDSALINCTIMNATLVNTVLDGCVLINCDVRDCRLKESHIKSSKVVNTKFINSLRSKCDFSPTPPLSPFKRIPPEVRIMIILKVIMWKGTTPPLIAALRGDPVLYREALDVLHKTSTFRLHWKNEVPREIMGRTAFQSIRKLDIK